MLPWTAYSAVLATLLSITCLTYLARREHITDRPRTLSVLAAETQNALKYFRVVLWICGTLFAVTMYFFVIPNINYAYWQAAAWSLTYVSEMLLAAIPAIGKSVRTHNVLSFSMGAGMLGSAVVFAFSLNHAYMYIEALLSTAMVTLGLLTFFDEKRYIFYELPFIYLAHISIVVAVFALR